MKFYKIRHKPTGLFFTPNKGHGNFSTTGKIYTSRPQKNWAVNPTVVVRFSKRSPSLREAPLIKHFELQPTRERNDRFRIGKYGRKKKKEGKDYNIHQIYEAPLKEWEIVEYYGEEVSNNSGN